MYWAEPLVEVDTSSGRLAYGPVAVGDVAGLFDAGFLSGGAHALALGATEEISFLKNQERLTFARVGITDPISLDDYLAHGGYRGLQRAVIGFIVWTLVAVTAFLDRKAWALRCEHARLGVGIAGYAIAFWLLRSPLAVFVALTSILSFAALSRRKADPARGSA